MRLRTIVSSLIALIVVTSADVGADETDLFRARSLKCTFGPGAVFDWSATTPMVKKDRFDVTLQFDSIDLKNGKARSIGNASATDVVVIPSLEGVTFIEQTESGNLIFTTVFPVFKRGTDQFVSVTSRHINGIAGPLPSQYHGTCKVWQ